MTENKRWFAVQETGEDSWDYGSYDYIKAVKMLKEQGHGLIAVINEETEFCEQEIAFDQAVRYWLDLSGDRFDLKLVNIPDDYDGDDVVLSGRLSDAGIAEENDGEWTNKLDDYFESKGISPNEWEVG